MLLDFNLLFKKYQMKIDGVLHIGAHYGEEHHLYKSNNIQNIAYFEPLKKNFDILKKNINDDSMLFNVALGSFSGQVEMHVEVANQGQSSSILEPELHLVQYPHIKFNSKELVEIKKLDDIDLKNKKFDMINIDVQGYELEVFKGSIKILNKIQYIICEVNRAPVYKNCAMVEELDSFLSQFNFCRVETDWAGRTWGDALYIKKQ